MSKVVVRAKVVDISLVKKGSVSVTDRAFSTADESIDVTVEGPHCTETVFRVRADPTTVRSFPIGASIKITFERDSEDEDDQ